jgi:23S rRNA (uracil1939-C5)-methyltransferase
VTEATRRPRPGDLVELEIAGYDARGRAFGHVDGRKFMLDGGPLGARVRAEVRKRRRGNFEARRVETLDAGPAATVPRCEHFGTCGGCRWQDLAYDAQLDVLRQGLASVAEPLVAAGAELLPVVGCDDPWAYRNKMDFTFASRRFVMADEPDGADAAFALGLHVPGRWDKVLDVHGCDIAFPEAAEIVAAARAIAREQGLAPWDVRAHTGLLRHLVVRRSHATGEVLVYLVTSEAEQRTIERYVAALLSAQPAITTLVHGVRTGQAAVAVGESERVLHGAGTIEEELAGLRFRISPASFFQTNTAQAERLVEIVRAEAALTGDEVLFDLFCGGGTFALPLAADARAVHGFELVPSAVDDARRNAERNGVEGTRFTAGDLVETLPAALAAEPGLAPDVCVVDPPRAGVHAKTLRALAELAPRRIVYVSCNPAAGVRDVQALVDAGYTARRIRPVDLFPHTPHLEAVFTLERAVSAAGSSG